MSAELFSSLWTSDGCTYISYVPQLYGISTHGFTLSEVPCFIGLNLVDVTIDNLYMATRIIKPVIVYNQDILGETPCQRRLLMLQDFVYLTDLKVEK
jgi:hypothetical protein